MTPPRTGQWLNRRHIVGVVVGVGVLLFAVLVLALRSSQQQALQSQASDQAETPPVAGTGVDEALQAAARRPYVLKDPEQPRETVTLSQVINHDEVTRLRDELAQQRQAFEAQMADMQQALTAAQQAKPVKAPTTTPVHTAAQQEAKEAARRAAEELKARRTSKMGLLRHDQEDRERSTRQARYHGPVSDRFLSAGSIIHCKLESAVNSEHHVPVLARVTSPVYDSVTGQPLDLLWDSLLIGQYAGFVYGEDTLNITWTRWEFGKHGHMDLGSQPSGDETGQAGLEGEIDNKWGQRLAGLAVGSVLRASMVATTQIVSDSATSAAGAAAAQHAANQGGQDLMRTMNVQSTIHVAAGRRCSMTLKESIDFSGVRP